MLEKMASFALKLTPEFDLCGQIGECAPSICEKGESNGLGGRLQDRCSFITSGGLHRGSGGKSSFVTYVLILDDRLEEDNDQVLFFS